MKEIDVKYKKDKKGVVPTQGYEEDFAYDMYASKGVLVPPLTFKSIKVPTGLRTEFNPLEVGMKVSLRSGVASKTPLVLSNSPGIIEGTYRGELQILVRNSFIDSHLVNFAFNLKGERVYLKDIPSYVLKEARNFYEEETELLGYDDVGEEHYETVYRRLVPRGTVYIAEKDRLAQLHMSSKYKINWCPTKKLTETVRGEKGIGSSGIKNKEEN